MTEEPNPDAVAAQQRLVHRRDELIAERAKRRAEKEKEEFAQKIAVHVSDIWMEITKIYTLYAPIDKLIDTTGKKALIKHGHATIELHRNGRIEIHAGQVDIRGHVTINGVEY